MNGAPTMLQTTGLDVRVGRRRLIAGLDLQIQAGELWCLLGVNGTGKTLLLQTLAGLRAPAAGTVQLAGRALAAWDAPELARQRGLMTQHHHDAFPSPVIDLVLQGRHPHLARWRWEGPLDRQLAQAALERVGLAGFEDRDVASLSGGERQRVALATLLVQDPPLMLLDEPLAHLDLARQIAVSELLAGEVRGGQRAVLMSVHDLNLAERVASHVLLLGPSATLAGPVETVLSEAALAAAFGHPVRSHAIDGRRWWLPV